MSDLNVARRYADALIEVASESSSVEAIGKDLQNVENVLMAHDGKLHGFFSSPVFTTEEREAVLLQILPRLGVGNFTQNFLKVVNSNGRFAVLPVIRSEYDKLADVRAGRVRVKVSTAEPLTPQLETEVKAALESSTGKTVIVEHTVDPSLIGGMVARIGGTVYDSSLRTKLQALKAALVVGQA